MHGRHILSFRMYYMQNEIYQFVGGKVGKFSMENEENSSKMMTKQVKSKFSVYGIYTE